MPDRRDLQCRGDQQLNAQDTLTLNTLTDDVYGNITQVQGNVISTTCGQVAGAGTLPFVIAAAGNYTCSFVGRINSCDMTVVDTVTGSATDDDGVTLHAVRYRHGRRYRHKAVVEAVSASDLGGPRPSRGPPRSPPFVTESLLRVGTASTKHVIEESGLTS